MTTDVQTVVVGAGVVGLAIARQLALSGDDVCVIDAQPAIGQGISSRNSEVIHAGIYYPKDSLKAKLCVRGKDLLYNYCRERHLTAKAIGKMIVATSANEHDTLMQLKNKALENGVADIELLNADTAIAMQPSLNCTAALHSPSTGVVDSHGLMVSLQGDIENHGGNVVCNAPATKLTIKPGHFEIQIGGESAMELTCNKVINSTGLNAIDLAQSTVNMPQTSVPDARFAKGNYFKLQHPAPFEKLIYPAPVSGGLGVHLTLDIAGQARFGPDVEWLQNSAPFNYTVDPARSNSFYDAIRRYWPALPDNALQPDYAGIRPKIDNNTDFQIATHSHHGISGLVHLFGIESPGLTSSLAIAEYVRDALQH